MKSKYGDKGGLEYIVKTQKLDNIGAREFENRVQVEDYDPAAKRAAADKKHAEDRARKKEQVAGRGGGGNTNRSKQSGAGDTILPQI